MVAFIVGLLYALPSLLIVLLPTAGIMGLAVAEVLAAIANVGVRYRYLVRGGVIARFPFRSFVVCDREDRANARIFAAHIRALLRFGRRATVSLL